MLSFQVAEGSLPLSIPLHMWGLDSSTASPRREPPPCANDIEMPGAASRLTAMSMMASTLAHELAQPITASQNYMQACAYALRHKIGGLEELLAMVESASAQALKAGEIIHRMRAFLVSGKIAGERVDLAELIARACAGVDAGGAEIVRLVPPGSVATADRVQIEQVVSNLVANAIQAMEGGALRRVTITAERQGAMIAVRVADSGPGLPEAALGRLFEPFFTTKATGTGLGLVLCRAIVEAHGGRIWSESPPDGGAVFAFTLPAAEA